MHLNYLFFPGCTQNSSAGEYLESTHSVAEQLGVVIDELPDWNCCGASSAHIKDHFLSIALPARNLAIAKKEDRDITVICAACYSRLKSAQKEILESDSMAAKVEETIGMDPRYEGRIVHFLDVVYDEIGLERIQKLIKIRLNGLKPVSYYGCLMARPRWLMEGDNPENPTRMNEILQSLGTSPKKWSYSTDCCGGSLSLTRTDVVVKLVNRLFDAVEDAGANCIVASCPMCVANLEMRQREWKLNFDTPRKIPVFFFTELIALALGEYEESKGWFGKHLVDPLPLLERVGISA